MLSILIGLVANEFDTSFNSVTWVSIELHQQLFKSNIIHMKYKNFKILFRASTEGQIKSANFLEDPLRLGEGMVRLSKVKKV